MQYSPIKTGSKGIARPVRNAEDPVSSSHVDPEEEDDTSEEETDEGWGHPEAAASDDATFGAALQVAVTATPPGLRLPLVVPPWGSVSLSPSSSGARASLSLEYLEPVHDDAARVAPIWSCVLSMLSTIVGGGALSLPYALRLMGLPLGFAVVLAFAAASDFALYALCASSRRTGPAALPALCRVAFGSEHAENVVIFALFALCAFVVVAYVRLLRDLLGLVVAEDRVGAWLWAAVVAVIFPLSLFRELHRLRYAAFLACGGAVMVAALFAARAPAVWQQQQQQQQGTGAEARAQWVRALMRPDPSPDASVLSAIPIVSMLYMCQFNVLSVHSKLFNPSRDRLKALIHWAIGSSTAFYLVYGTVGVVVCAGSDLAVAQDALNCLVSTKTDDDKGASSAPARDVLLATAGAAFAVSILLNTPGIVIPFRESFFTLVSKCRCRRGPSPPERRSLLQQAADAAAAADPTRRKTDLGALAGHIGVTAVLVFACALAALRVPGVATVWSIGGASVGLFIAFILPTALYLRVRRLKTDPPARRRKAVCRLMLAANVVLAVICTARNIRAAFFTQKDDS